MDPMGVDISDHSQAPGFNFTKRKMCFPADTMFGFQPTLRGIFFPKHIYPLVGFFARFFLFSQKKNCTTFRKKKRDVLTDTSPIVFQIADFLGTPKHLLSLGLMTGGFRMSGMSGLFQEDGGLLLETNWVIHLMYCQSTVLCCMYMYSVNISWSLEKVFWRLTRHICVFQHVRNLMPFISNSYPTPLHFFL